MKNKSTTLHLGCGFTKHVDAVGVDKNPRTNADVIADLNVFPYPFVTNQFQLIIAEHIIEHLDDVVAVMEELHRITKPGARIQITSSHFSSVDSFTDPTHKHFLTSRTFDYFIPGTDLYKFQYSSARFALKKIQLGPLSKTSLPLTLLLQLINRYRVFYESRLAFLFPVGSLYVELETLK